MQIIKSVSDDQVEIIENIMKLNQLDRFDIDVTYGNGQFWKKLPKPVYCFDIDDNLPDAMCYASDDLPFDDSTLGSMMFDPPFLTYVRAARGGNGEMVMAKRFSGYWKYSELEEHYRNTINEAARVISHKGIMVIKCQDIIHNHKMHCTHVNVINWAKDNFRLKDLFILQAKHRMPSPNRKGVQKHARVFHSYFLVLERLK